MKNTLLYVALIVMMGNCFWANYNCSKYEDLSYESLDVAEDAINTMRKYKNQRDSLQLIVQQYEQGN